MYDVWESEESSLITSPRRLQSVDYLFCFVCGITIVHYDINGATIIVEWVSSSYHPIYIVLTMFGLRHGAIVSTQFGSCYSCQWLLLVVRVIRRRHLQSGPYVGRQRYAGANE